MNIESNIAPPVRGRFIYPFSAMNVGDSFLVTDVDVGHKVRSAAAQFQSRNKGYRFTTRKTPEGVRVWRIAA